MAQVKITQVKIISLELSENEAQTLADVVNACLGSMETSRRKHSNEIWSALNRAGFRGIEVNDMIGRITFK